MFFTATTTYAQENKCDLKADNRELLDGAIVDNASCIWRYQNGMLEKEMPYDKGKWNGLHKLYYENGKIKRKVSYKGGSREGVTKYYSDDGRLFIEAISKDNDYISGTCYKNNGLKTPLTETEIINLSYGIDFTCE